MGSREQIVSFYVTNGKLNTTVKYKNCYHLEIVVKGSADSQTHQGERRKSTTFSMLSFLSSDMTELYEHDYTSIPVGCKCTYSALGLTHN